MPAIITHDLFAKDIYNEVFESVGGSRDEAEAFLLGNQGPDPLFYAAADPRYLAYAKLGTTIHEARPTELIVALKAAVPLLPSHQRSWARAYVLGFLCHYELDRTVHPLVYSQVNALCTAGVEGLGDEARSEVHAVIETDLDELALTRKRGETVASFNPATAVLKGSPAMLGAVSTLYARAVKDAFDLDIPQNLFAASVRAQRAAQRVLYSPKGWKRGALGAMERLVRPHSLLAALSHRGEERNHSPYANTDHQVWENPFTGQASTTDFWDLYDQARAGALRAIAAVDGDGFSLEDARVLTGDLNFRGEPVVATVMAVEDVSAPAAAGAPSDPAR
ncbi:peptidase [Adlercreutzia sp. R7]|uniref:Peptidase n=1 Tax=Adlercreutzia wanghongyangiae TaxID=3111451 RepID=A0ABU6IKD9_9ACTN|nr:peptidase [Adlercreutzia sp. R7]